MSYLEENPVRRNLRCPHCKGDDLSFVTEYHRANALRFFEMLCIAILIFTVVSNLSDLSKINSRMGVLLITIISWFIFYAARCFVESKTHVQAICRTCGNMWLLD